MTSCMPSKAALISARIKDGKLSLDTPAGDYIEEWKHQPDLNKITVGQMLQMSDGLDLDEIYNPGSDVTNMLFLGSGTKLRNSCLCWVRVRVRVRVRIWYETLACVGILWLSFSCFFFNWSREEDNWWDVIQPMTKTGGATPLPVLSPSLPLSLSRQQQATSFIYADRTVRVRSQIPMTSYKTNNN